MDIIVDLETLGTDVDSTVIQIAASEFDITTGKLVGQPFNECVDLHYVPEIKASGSTLKFWLGHPENQKVIRDIVARGESARNSEYQLWNAFFVWLMEKSIECDGKLKLWGNGISFDNMIIKHHLGKDHIILGMDVIVKLLNSGMNVMHVPWLICIAVKQKHLIVTSKIQFQMKINMMQCQILSGKQNF